MATVELRFSALPEHVRTARLVAAAVARRAGVDESVLDEVRLAVGEACSRAVGLHRRSGVEDPVRVTLVEQEKRFLIEVGDGVGHESEPATPAAAGDTDDSAEDAMGLAVISGLVDDLDVGSDDIGGVIRMSWPVAVHEVSV
ncbi:ATP-binding protein [Peterkaempfera bronchialis]|uniref:ATP-binding protein n=1 Tax=Peterkaempfera bronchialis TaxID=2126346 RepID=A0A345SYL8_9ACTN|nr:ATP-binding protein [Peterkaempfera bronchialis]AXI78823.1 ATP-binding protein [Peterkaempfera bronchialis]